MKAGNLIILGAWLAFTCAFIVRLIHQLASGELSGSGEKPASSRRENPKSYWSKMSLELVMAAAMVGMLLLGFRTLIDWRLVWH